MASEVPSLAYARLDVKSEKPGPFLAIGVGPGQPALKAFFRNGPPGKRVLEYRGPPTHEAVLEWVKAVEAWDGKSESPPGWEVGREEPLVAEPSAEQRSRGAGPRGDMPSHMRGAGETESTESRQAAGAKDET